MEIAFVYPMGSKQLVKQEINYTYMLHTNASLKIQINLVLKSEYLITCSTIL